MHSSSWHAPVQHFSGYLAVFLLFQTQVPGYFIACATEEAFSYPKQHGKHFKLFTLSAMHQLTGSLLCKRCRKAAKEVKDMQRNVQKPPTGLYLGLQDTETTWDGDRGTKGAKTPKCRISELCAASQRYRMLRGNSSLDPRVGLYTCFVSDRIFTCPVIL